MNTTTTVSLSRLGVLVDFVGESDAAVNAMTISVRLLMGNHRLFSVRRVPVRVGLAGSPLVSPGGG